MEGLPVCYILFMKYGKIPHFYEVLMEILTQLIKFIDTLAKEKLECYKKTNTIGRT